jgi:hypothetical protein
MGVRQIERAPLVDVIRSETRSVRRPPAPRGRQAEAPVEISLQAERLRAQRQILRSAFGGVEESYESAGRALFEAAGRSKYLDSIAQVTDLSPQATAQRILGGITGYIYGAFRLAHPGATVEDFDGFAADVLRGFEQGLGEARSLIEGLAALTPELASGIERTETLVREGLEVFFADERRRLEGADRRAR